MSKLTCESDHPPRSVLHEPRPGWATTVGRLLGGYAWFTEPDAVVSEACGPWTVCIAKSSGENHEKSRWFLRGGLWTLCIAYD
jgi:hypothetical protein